MAIIKNPISIIQQNGQGEITIDTDGTYDVSNYSIATVTVADKLASEYMSIVLGGTNE